LNSHCNNQAYDGDQQQGESDENYSHVSHNDEMRIC